MVKQISDKTDVEPIDLLQAFEIIVEKAKGSSLGEEFYQKSRTRIFVFCFLVNCVSPSEQVLSWPSLPTGVMIPISGF